MASQKTEHDETGHAAEAVSSPRRVFFWCFLPIALVQFFFVLLACTEFSSPVCADDFLAKLIRGTVAVATGIFLRFDREKSAGHSLSGAYFFSFLAFGLYLCKGRILPYFDLSGVVIPSYLMFETLAFTFFGGAIGCAMSCGTVRRGIKVILYSSLTASVFLSAPVLVSDNMASICRAPAVGPEISNEMDVHLLFLQCGKRPVRVKIAGSDYVSNFETASYLPKSKNCVSEAECFSTDRPIAALNPILPETLSGADLVIVNVTNPKNEAEKYLLSEKFLRQVIDGDPQCTLAVRNTPENAVVMDKLFPNRAVVTGYEKTWLVGGSKTTASAGEIDARAEEAQVYYNCGGDIPTGLFSINAARDVGTQADGHETALDRPGKLQVRITAVIVLAMLYLTLRFILTGRPGRKEVFISFENGFLISSVMTVFTVLSNAAGDGEGFTVFAAFFLCTALGFTFGNADKKEGNALSTRKTYFRDALSAAAVAITIAASFIFISETEFRKYFFLLQMISLFISGRAFGKFAHEEEDEKLSPSAAFSGFAIGMLAVYAFLSTPGVPVCIVACALLLKSAARLLNGRA